MLIIPILETANLTEVVGAMTEGIGLFTVEPLNYVVICAVIGFGVVIVKKFIGRIRR
ncbi:MAG: hypothetical protein QXX12_03800 [Nanopusillaceae archaeon]